MAAVFTIKLRRYKKRFIVAGVVIMLFVGYAFYAAFYGLQGNHDRNGKPRILSNSYTMKREISSMFDFSASGDTHFAYVQGYRGDTQTIAFTTVDEDEYNAWVDRLNIALIYHADYFNQKSLSDMYEGFDISSPHGLLI